MFNVARHHATIIFTFTLVGRQNAFRRFELPTGFVTDRHAILLREIYLGQVENAKLWYTISEPSHRSADQFST